MRRKQQLVICLVSVLTLGGCITTPRDTYSLFDIASLQARGWEPDFGGINRGEIEQEVRAEIATPLEFHGLVLDELGQAIAGHPVKAVIFDRVLHPFQSPYFGWSSLGDIRTDSEGRFDFSGLEGAALVVSVSNEEYWDVDDKRAQRIFYYSPSRRDSNLHPLPTARDAPAIFRLDRKPEAAGTELVRLGSILISPGEVAGIALRRPRYTVDVDDADLLVELLRGQPGDDGRYDWRLQVRAPGGGIQSVHSLFSDQAPEGGYLDALELGFDADHPQWNHRAELLCFLRTRKGNYASLTLRVRTLERPFVAISGKLNPHGERYLD